MAGEKEREICEFERVNDTHGDHIVLRPRADVFICSCAFKKLLNKRAEFLFAYTFSEAF